MKLNLTRRFSNLRFKRAASMSCAKCLGRANSQNERWKKRTRVTVIFPLYFDRYLLGRKKKIQNMAKQKLFILKRSEYVCVVVVHKVACWFQHLESLIPKHLEIIFIFQILQIYSCVPCLYCNLKKRFADKC